MSLSTTLDSNIAELKEQGHFVSPHLVLDFVDREGIGPIVNSRTPVDKMMVELWVTAIYTLCLNREHDYYLRLNRDDPPDTEVLIDNSENNTISMLRVEITQHGRHSADLIDVIGKKLRKRYQDGTVLLVLVEEEQRLSIPDLCDFVSKHNPHRQRIFIIGGAGEVGKFKVVPWERSYCAFPGRKGLGRNNCRHKRQEQGSLQVRWGRVQTTLHKQVSSFVSGIREDCRTAPLVNTASSNPRVGRRSFLRHRSAGCFDTILRHNPVGSPHSSGSSPGHARRRRPGRRTSRRQRRTSTSAPTELKR